MSELVRKKVEIVANAGYVLPTMLAMNTLLLFAYDGLLGIPGWVKVAATLFAHAYRVGVRNLPDGMSALQFTRHHLDRLGIGRNLSHLRWGSKTFTLPPSSLPPRTCARQMIRM